MKVISKPVLRYSDTDQMGVIHHSTYALFFEQARDVFLKQYGVDYVQIESEGILFPVYDLHIVYHEAIRLQDQIEVITSVLKVTPIKLVFKHKVMCHDKVKATGESTIVCVSKETFKITRLSSVLPIFYDNLKGLV
jgi:acyl-CoA thioester hydrolase